MTLNYINKITVVLLVVLLNGCANKNTNRNLVNGLYTSPIGDFTCNLSNFYDNETKISNSFGSS